MLDPKDAKIKFLLEIIKTDGYSPEVKRHAKKGLKGLGVDVDGPSMEDDLSFVNTTSGSSFDVDVDEDKYDKLSDLVDKHLRIRAYGYQSESSKVMKTITATIFGILIGIGLIFGAVALWPSQSDTDTTLQVIESTTESGSEGRSL